MIEWLALLVGIGLLGYGAQLAVKGAARLAKILGIDKYGVGATIVATITSLPELAVASIAIMNGRAEIAVGTAVGSIIGLFLLSFGILGLMTRIKFGKRRKREILWATIIVTWITAILVSVRVVGLILGILLLGTYFAYMHTVHEGKLAELVKGEKPRRKAVKEIVVTAVGIALVLIGAEMVVWGSVGIARSLGIPEFFVAFFMVALGTNLPEIAVEISAVLRGHPEIAVGDIVGSAVADLTLVLGTTAIVGAATGHALVFNGTSHVVAGVMLGTALVGAKLSRDEELGKGEAVALLITYILVVWTELLLGAG